VAADGEQSRLDIEVCVYQVGEFQGLEMCWRTGVFERRIRYDRVGSADELDDCVGAHISRAWYFCLMV
jgi:hypothetical protein